jgi:8-oxo-dGTP pyrophosphatase MutT (NUDIX family)
MALQLRLLAISLINPVAFGVAAAIFDDHGRVLLVKHSYKPGWQFPGGGVERHEPPESALMRELREELGLKSGTATLFGVYTQRTGTVSNHVAFFRIDSAILDFKPNLEVREILFVAPDKLPDDCTSGTIRRVSELLGGPRSPYW